VRPRPRPRSRRLTPRRAPSRPRDCPPPLAESIPEGLYVDPDELAGIESAWGSGKKFTVRPGDARPAGAGSTVDVERMAAVAAADPRARPALEASVDMSFDGVALARHKRVVVSLPVHARYQPAAPGGSGAATMEVPAAAASFACGGAGRPGSVFRASTAGGLRWTVPVHSAGPVLAGAVSLVTAGVQVALGAVVVFVALAPVLGVDSVGDLVGAVAGKGGKID